MKKSAWLFMFVVGAAVGFAVCRVFAPKAAEAEAEANRLLADSLSDVILKSMYLEKWNGELPQYNGSGALPFINLGTK